MEQTLALIKPDAVQRRLVGAIISEIEKNDFRIVAIKTLRLTVTEAKTFYQAHRRKPFFDSLVEYMASGQIFVLLLEKEDAVEAWRKLHGHTDPAKAESGTLRSRFGIDVQQNSVHAADSLATALNEINFFFGEGQ
ncbi:MAG TPA: nucleoside-diphosphate kinase [Candidatus Binatia bacterium]|nr:nucleoside-diphosphate kinase [Candidatus Binatia bacterium]